jgi:hypothetical protein
VKTLTIPLTTLPVGSIDFGPETIVDSETKIVLTIDRTVTGGLNSLTAASVVAVDVSQSNDGGASWFLAVGGTFPGGVYVNGKGATVVVSTLLVDVYPGTSRQLKATVTVSGPVSVGVAGTLVTS